MKGVTQITKQSLTGRHFIGSVVAINDPDELERVKVRIPLVFDDILDDADLPWALPKKQRAQGATATVGSFGVPVVGTDVIVEFDAGERYSPLYSGSVITAGDLTKIAGTTYGATYGMQDAAGNILYVDTATNIAEFRHTSGTYIKVLANGAVTMVVDQNFTQTINGNVTQSITGNVVENVTGNVTKTVTGDYTLTATGILSITGTSALNLTSTGITAILGATITLN